LNEIPGCEGQLSLWKNDHLQYLSGALLLITLISPQTLSSKWFNDIRDLESLEKYSYAKARSYQARAEAFNQDTWPQRQFSKLSELWSSLPSLYRTSEEDLVGEHNREIDEKITAQKEDAQKEGRTLSAIDFLDDAYQHWSKASVINEVCDKIIKIKLHIKQQKKSRSYILRTEALTGDYCKAKSDQYLALSETAYGDKGLAKLYFNLSVAWSSSDPDKIGEAKLEVLKKKQAYSHYIQSVSAKKIEDNTKEAYPYNLPEKPITPFFLRKPLKPVLIPLPPLFGIISPFPVMPALRCGSFAPFSSIHTASDSLFWLAPLEKTVINEELFRLAAKAVLPARVSSDFYTEINRGWLITTKTQAPQKDTEFWKNHLFYSDYLKSEFGINIGESFSIIKILMI